MTLLGMSNNRSSSNSSQPHILCRLCKSFWERATCLSFQPKELLRGGEKVPSMPQHLLLSSHRVDVLSSASLGCHFCSIIVGAVVGCTGDHGGRQFIDDQDGPIYISIAVLDPETCAFLLTLFPCQESRIRSHDQILNDSPLQLRLTKGIVFPPKSLDLLKADSSS